MKNKMNSFFQSIKESFQTRSFRVGGYSFAAMAIVLAIAVAANLLISALPENYTKIDVSSNDLYTLSAQSESIATGLTQDVDIYWMVQQGKEDSNVETLLGRYTGLSDKIHVTKKDPDVYPTFASQYTDETVYNNSLIVVSGTRSKFVSYSDIYEYDYSNYYSTGSYDVAFAGENQITSALDYVTLEEMPVLYTLQGHGESELSSTFTSAIESENVEIKELSLVSENEVPEDASCLLIYAPQSDISEEELEILENYMAADGKLILITDPQQTENERPNLDALAAVYGLSETEGILVETSSSNYAFGMPYYLLPNLQSHDITDPLIDENYYVLLPLAHGISQTETVDGVTVTTLMKTSDAALSKIAGYQMTTFDKEEGDTEGIFAVAVLAEKADGEDSSVFLWVGSAGLLDDSTNSRVSGGNENLFLNAISYICGQESSISIRAKTMSYNYLTMNSATSAVITAIILAVIPGICIAAGIYIRVERKRR